MTKTLYVIRHGKSSWNFRQLDDFNRPLGKRGRRDVMKMGKYLAKNHPPPDQIITSPASRAFYTSLYFADHWRFPEDQIQLEPQLYHADEEEIIEIIKSDGEGETIAIFGHNPGFTELINGISKDYLDNLPTCSAYGICFQINAWADLDIKRGEKLFMYRPKEI